MLCHVSEQALVMVTDPEELQAMLTRQPEVVETQAWEPSRPGHEPQQCDFVVWASYIATLNLNLYLCSM